MEYQNRWSLRLLGDSNNIDISPTLEKEVASDYLVIGGGVAGLHAAQALLEKKCAVTLVEKNMCGGGMSGRSGGFLTPDSELGIRQIEKQYGTTLAKKIWQFGSEGQQYIVQNIHGYSLHCDLRKQDSLLLGVGKKGITAVQEEYQDRKMFHFDAELISRQQLPQHNSGTCYTSGLRYTDCYAINPMQYCQELKHNLIKQGLRVYEFTHVNHVGQTYAKTNLGGIRFKQAVICPGKAEEMIFPGHAKYTYGIQNYIAISEPVNEKQVISMMPSGECMCRDTKLVFTYYRLTGQKRIILGGGTPISSFQPRDVLHQYTIASVISDFKKTFPVLTNVEFPHYWSGRIQASKDLIPLIGPSKRFGNHYRVQGAVGLPWAGACGRFVTTLLHDEADEELTNIFSYERDFFIPRFPHTNLLKAPVFGLNHAKVLGLW